MKSSLVALLTAAALTLSLTGASFAQETPTTTPEQECAAGTAEGASTPESLTETSDDEADDGASTSDTAKCCVTVDGTANANCPPEETTSGDNDSGTAPTTNGSEDENGSDDEGSDSN